VKHPVGAVLGQSELSDCHVAVEQVVPQLALCGVDAERNEEGVATPGLRDAPAELVFSVVGVVETPSSVREPDRVVVFELRSIVRVPKLRDVVLERVLRVGRERVRRDDIVDRCLRVRATLERIGGRVGTSPRYAEAVALLCAVGGASVASSFFSWRWRSHRVLQHQKHIKRTETNKDA